MSSENGLFENPNLEQQQAEQEQATLAEIKEDTGAIRAAIYNVGADNLQALERIAYGNRIKHKGEEKLLTELNKVVNLSPTYQQWQANNAKTPHQKALAEVYRKEQAQKEKRVQRLAEISKNPTEIIPEHRQKGIEKIRQARTAREQARQNPPSQSPQAGRSPQKFLNVPEKNKALPNGWKRDSLGRVRDPKGRYVSPKELQQHNIKPLESPSKTKENPSNDTIREASERRVLEALGNIRQAVEGSENVDPMVNMGKEISEPLKAVFSPIKPLATGIIKSSTKMFARNPPEKRWRDRLFGRFMKSTLANEKQQNRIIGWLQRIWKKPDKGSGWLSRLLLALAFIPKFFKGAFARLLGGVLGGRIGKALAFLLTPFKAIGRIVANLGKGLFKGLGLDKLFGLFAKLGKGLGGLFGGLGKGLLKRIPILGSLFAFADGGMAGGIGSIIGGVIGSIFGPIGTLIGALVGEKIGVWLAGLNWAEIGKTISDKWISFTDWLSTLWQPIGDWFKTKWENVGEYFSQKWKAVTESFSALWMNTKKWFSEKWETALKNFTDIWDNIGKWFSDLVPDWVKDLGGSAKQAVGSAWNFTQEAGSKIYTSSKEWVSNKYQSVKNTASTVYHSVANGVSSAISNITNWFGSNGENTLEQSQITQEEIQVDTSRLTEEIVKANGFLQAIQNYARELIETIKDKFNSFMAPTTSYAVDQNGVPQPQSSVAEVAMNVANSAETAIKNSKFAGFGADVDSYIKEASQRYGIDEKVLRGFVKMEGGWTGKMSATGAIGTGQFIKKTWNDLAKTKEGKAIGMTLITDDNFRTSNDPRHNKRINTLATGLLAKNNSKILAKYGLEATGENLYMAHNIGAYGFARAITGKANKEEMNNMRVNGMKEGMTPQEFVAFQKKRFQTHYEIANRSSYNTAMTSTQTVEKSPSIISKVAQLATQPVMEYSPPPPKAPDIPVMNSEQIAKQVIASTPKPTTQKTEEKEKITPMPQAPDLIYQFLTQDVSERRIAHIVTGGLVRAGGRI